MVVGVASVAFSCLHVRGSRQAAPDMGSCWGGRRVRRLHCAARSYGPSPNSLRSLRSATFKQAATSQSTNALRAGPQALRCSSPQKSPPPGTARREQQPYWLFDGTPTTHPQRRVRAGRGAPLRRRGAELWGRRACALQQLTRRRLFERSEPKVSGVSSTARPQSEHRSGVGGTPPTAEAKRSGLPGRAFAAQPVALRLGLRRLQWN